MTTDPIRELILENIKTELAKIKTTAGYRTNISSVQRWDMRGNIIANTPCIIISAGEDVWAEGYSNMRCKLTVFLDVIIRQTEASTDPTEKEMNKIVEDIFKCLWADATRGGNAIETHIANITPYEIVEGEPQAGLFIELSILYGFQQSNPGAVG